MNEVSIVKSPTSSLTLSLSANHPNGRKIGDKEEEEEYVTSFYKRVRNKHRCNLFGKVLEECSSQHQSGVGGVSRSGSDMVNEQQSVQSSGYDGIDHSLDHYFDHELRTSSSSTPYDSAQGYGQQQQQHKSAHAETPYSSSSSSSSRAQAVRGGGGGRRMVHKPSTFASETIWAPPRASGYKNRRSHSHGGTSQSCRSAHHSVDLDFDNDEYDSSLNLEDDIQDILDGIELEDEDDSCISGSVDSVGEHHHLGLLRVPCSIAVNCGEATHHASSHGTS